MPAKYHIKKNGDPGVCHATLKDCPLGGAHFTSVDSAREFYEESNTSKTFFNSFRRKKNKNEKLNRIIEEKERQLGRPSNILEKFEAISQNSEYSDKDIQGLNEMIDYEKSKEFQYIRDNYEKYYDQVKIGLVPRKEDYEYASNFVKARTIEEFFKKSEDENSNVSGLDWVSVIGTRKEEFGEIRPQKVTKENLDKYYKTIMQNPTVRAKSDEYMKIKVFEEALFKHIERLNEKGIIHPAEDYFKKEERDYVPYPKQKDMLLERKKEWEDNKHPSGYIANMSNYRTDKEVNLDFINERLREYDYFQERKGRTGSSSIMRNVFKYLNDKGYDEQNWTNQKNWGHNI